MGWLLLKALGGTHHGKDGSSLGCDGALQAGHQEHTCNSTSWDPYWFVDQLRPHTLGTHGAPLIRLGLRGLGNHLQGPGKV